MVSICFWDNIVYNKQVKNENNGIPKTVPIMEDRFSDPLRIPDFRVLETGETGETYAIL